MVNRADIDQRIKNKMDHLQRLMESNAHLDRKEYVLDVCSSASKYFNAMSEEDRDYLQCAQYAVEEGKEWNIPEDKRLIINEDDGYTD